jgi:hypothetical protein
LGPRVQGVGQWHVSVQTPFTHTAPLAQVTLAHGLTTHEPLTQNWSDGHVTPSHGPCGMHWMLQTLPVLHGASHGWMGEHIPESGSQY